MTPKALIENIMQRRGIKYDPSQPRVPAGSPDGGQWTDGSADVTQTEAFKKWFKNSKVVDQNGAPLVVYHGGEKEIEDFSRGAERGGAAGLAHFTSEREVANAYATTGMPIGSESDIARDGAVTSVYLSIQDPLTDATSFEEFFKGDIERAWTFVRDEIDDYDLREEMEALKDSSPAKFWEQVGKAEMTGIFPTDLSFPMRGSSLLQLVTANMFLDEEFRAEVKQQYDGFIFKDAENGGTSYIVFSPNQIKSAENNYGAFDSDSSNIRRSTVASRGSSFTKQASSLAIDRIANRLSPQLRKRFLAAVQAAKGNIDLVVLERALIAGSQTYAEDAVELDEWEETFSPVRVDSRAGFLAGASAAYILLERMSGGIPPQEQFPAANDAPENPFRLIGRFDLINPESVRYANEKLPKIVGAYREHARENIRDIVAEAVSGKYTAQDAARLIKDEIGLTRQYAKAVRNYREKLTAEGLQQDKVAKKVERYSDKLLRARAKTIARTEILQAQAAGQRALWNEAARNGLINKQTAKNVWVTHFDERECPICAELDGQKVPFGSVYTHPVLGSLNSFGEPLLPTHAHPNCRCSEDLLL